MTPSHFLIGKSITSLPDHDFLDLPSNRLTKFKHVQQLKQRFWSRFSTEYITQLHKIYKWNGPSPYMEPGSLVLIKTNTQPPNKWVLGRITRFFPGADDVNRVAEVATSNGPIKRSTRHLYPLPTEDSYSQLTMPKTSAVPQS